MKRTLFVFLAILFVFATMISAANACTGYGCWEPPTPLEGSAEGQAFQHLDIAYGQQAGVQLIDQKSVTAVAKTEDAINAEVYGSFHSDPDVLVFGKGSGSITHTDTASLTIACVKADVNVMNGELVVAGDAGASAAATGSGAVVSAAGNNFAVNQAQYLPYNHGGFGVTALAASGFTTVNASAGK